MYCSTHSAQWHHCVFTLGVWALPKNADVQLHFHHNTMQCNLARYCIDQSNRKSGRSLCNLSLFLNKPPQHTFFIRVFPDSAFWKRYNFYNFESIRHPSCWNETVKMGLKCSVVNHLAKSVLNLIQRAFHCWRQNVPKESRKWRQLQ